MIEKKDLEELGFTGFEHLSKDFRDGKIRMTWVGDLDSHFLTVLLLQNENHWKIELLKTDPISIKEKYFTANPTLDEVIQVIRNYGRLLGANS